jgi:hypothetical protein
MRLSLSVHRSIAASCAVLVSLLVVGCESADDRAHKSTLEVLVQRGATRANVLRELGPGHTVYDKGTPTWDSLESFLRREPASDLRPLRENVTNYPTVVYYTTAWRMTWIFLDEKDVIRTYYLTAQ